MQPRKHEDTKNVTKVGFVLISLFACAWVMAAAPETIKVDGGQITGAAADGVLESVQVAASFRGEEEDDLLSFIGHDDADTFFGDPAIPGFYLGEPGVGRRIGGAA